LAAGQPAYVPTWRLTPAEGIRWIQGAGGLAVLAHGGKTHSDQAISQLVNDGLDGLEILHPEHGTMEVARLRRVAAELGQEVTTRILPASTFYLAEDYHQKYSLRGKKLFYEELAAVYPTTEELIASTAAARINGYLGGYGTKAQLDRELDILGLSPEASEDLLRRVR